MAQQFHSWSFILENESLGLLKVLYMNINSSIQNNLKVEITQMLINWWMPKQNVLHLHSGILFSNEKEWTSNTYYNMDDPQKH